jgi:DNA polymerase epsilon subunit 2
MTGYTQQEESELLRLEEESEETMFVMLSDVHLDSPEVLHKLRLMFEGFSSCPPAMFVFMGNFTSQPFGKDSSDVLEYQKCFDDLATLLLEFPSLFGSIENNTTAKSKILFVPGPNDPGTKVLPRAPIPQFFTRNLMQRLPKETVKFTTNPCRVRYFTQEIVIYRDDILNRMRRQCVVPPIVKTTVNAENEGGDGEEDDVDVTSAVTEHLVKTVLDQGHLCPLPLNQVPIRWTHDSSLRLYPLPDLLMMADHYDQYHSSYQGCAAVNPGSFPTDFSFLVYRPYSRGVEFSRIG